MTRKIVIDPVTRVEGHGKVTIHLDENGNVSDSRFHIVEFRGFERFVQSRPFWEMPVLVQRLCGICPVSHHLAAAKALDAVVGTDTEHMSPTAIAIRRLMHYGQIFQSHALHFFHLSSPDLLFGVDADPSIRNVIGLIKDDRFREIAKKGVLMRKFGQEVIQATAGKKIHGNGAIPGGVNRSLHPDDRIRLLVGDHDFNVDRMIEWSLEALELFKGYHKENREFIDGFASFPSSSLSLVRKDGAMDLFHGVLRAVDSEGNKILDDVDYRDYYKYIAEGVKPWSYLKFPYLRSLGPEKGWYRVGPLARMNTADFIPTPLAQREFEEFRAYTGGKPNGHSMHTHWARLIEILHSAEIMKDLLQLPEIQGDVITCRGERINEGVGVIEAPRGTLFHHYRVGDTDQIEMANLIVSTTNNNEAMNRAVNEAARMAMNGAKEITEPMMNMVEVAIRAYDPCLSCATHAIGQMPLEISLYQGEDQLLDRKIRGDGTAGGCCAIPESPGS